MDEREDEKKIFPWRRFSLFLYPSFRVLRRGKRTDVYGPWLGFSPGWAFWKEILLSQASCFQRCSEEAVVISWIYWTWKVDATEIWNLESVSMSLQMDRWIANDHPPKKKKKESNYYTLKITKWTNEMFRAIRGPSHSWSMVTISPLRKWNHPFSFSVFEQKEPFFPKRRHHINKEGNPDLASKWIFSWIFVLALQLPPCRRVSICHPTKH